MKHSFSLFFLAACLALHAERYVGGDISMLPQYEQYSSGYRDVYGSKISNLMQWLIDDCGWNTFRVRLFVTPQRKAPDYVTNDYAVCQDLDYVTALGRRIKDAGAWFMLDLHYSDSWVDAAHIQAPKAWKGASDAAMADSLAAYTLRVLEALNAAGATPDMVQVGNEIMYGLCDIKVAPYDKADSNWQGFLGLLRAGCNAVREKCPNAQIIIHTDRPCNSGYNNYFYGKLINGGVDFDIIGLSYYPFWHANYTPTAASTSEQVLYPLVRAVNALKTQFPDKRVHIVETATNFQYWPTAGVNYDTSPVWPATKVGQYTFVRALVDAMLPLDNLDGICYWFPEDAGNGDYVNWTTKDGLIEETWSNRGFWSEEASTSGHAINRTGSVSGDKTPEDVCAPYYMGKFAQSDTQGFDLTPSLEGRAGEGLKLLRDGQLIILRNGLEYTPDGKLTTRTHSTTKN